MRWLSVFAALLICLAAAYFFLFDKAERPQAPPADQLQAGSMAPDFTLKDLKGNSVTLRNSAEKWFLNFWATMVSPCRAEMPAMERLNEVYGSQISSCWPSISKKTSRPSSFPPRKIPILFRAARPRGQRAESLRCLPFPGDLSHDKKGKIVERYLGAWTGLVLISSKINDLMKE
jgi:thiol-disulfide isomerase/thioredoxin